MLSQQGRVFTMEAMTLEQILIQPVFDEIEINFKSSVDNTPLDLADLANWNIPIQQVKKSQAEQNNEKGAQNLLLIPINHRDLQGKSAISLVSLDYSPMPSKSKLFQSEYKTERETFTMESLRNLASYFQQLGQIGIMDDSGTSSIGYKTSSAVSADVAFSNVINASKEESSRGNWAMVNYLLGAVAFVMFAYLIKTMQKKNSGGGGRGGGARGGSGRRGGRAGGPWGPSGRSTRGGGGSGRFGGRR